MKKLLYILIPVIFIVFQQCNNNTDDKLFSYIKNNCKFNNCDTCCQINFKYIFKIDYDTMYIFHEYTVLNIIRNVLHIKGYRQTENANTILIDDSHYKIILLKNHKILYEDDFEYKHTYIDKGYVIEKKGIFDSNTITDYAFLYTSPIFFVEKKLNDTGREFYVLTEIKK